MGINVKLASNQAEELLRQAEELMIAARLMAEYKASINSSWRGKEVSYISSSIDDNIAKIKKTIEETVSLANDIAATAKEIKHEEEEAAAKARAEKERRVKIAREAYDNSVEKYNALIERKTQLENHYASVPKTQENLAYLVQLYNEYQALLKEIDVAYSEYEVCLNALNNAMR